MHFVGLQGFLHDFFIPAEGPKTISAVDVLDSRSTCRFVGKVKHPRPRLGGFYIFSKPCGDFAGSGKECL